MVRASYLFLSALLAGAVLARAESCDSYASHLRWVGTAETPQEARRSVLRNGYLYVADGNGLTILALDELGGTSLVSRLSFAVPVYDVTLVRNHAVLAAGIGGLVAVDVSSPHAPRVTSAQSFGPTISARAVAAEGSMVFIAAARSGPGGNLFALDFSDPSSPILLGTILTPWRATALRVRDGLAYVTDTMCFEELGCFGGLGVFDVSDPTALDEIGYVGLGPSPGFELVDQYAYVPSPLFGLWIVDVSNPFVPEIVLQHGGFEGFGVVRTEEALLVTGDALRVLDIADRTTPIEIARLALPPGGGAGAIGAGGGWAFVAAGGELQVVDAQNVAPLPFLASVAALSSIDALAAEGALVALADGASVRLFDWADGEHPLERGGATLPEPATHLAFEGSLLYAGCGRSGLAVLDASDPTHPSLLRVVALEGDAGDVAVDAGFVYVCSTGESALDHGVRIVDARVPASAHEVFFTPLADRPAALDLEDDLLFVAAESAGLLLFDRSSPDALTPKATLPLPAAVDVSAVREKVVLADATLGLVQVDVRMPSKPFLVGSTLLSGPVTAVLASDRTIFAAAGADGVFAFGSRGGQDAPCGWLNGRGVALAESAGGSLLVAGGTAGLRAFPPRCSIDATLPPTGARDGVATTARHVVSAGGPVRIPVHPTLGGPATLVVYDARGREIRRVTDVGLGDAIVWDGHDRSGRTLPAGTYLYVLSAGNRVQRGKVAKLR